MKITSQEEYGLRILIRIAGCPPDAGMTIPQLAEAEGIGHHYVAKLARLLRLEGFINSTPGNKGGYVLARPAQEINIRLVLAALGGVLYDIKFCELHAGALKLCNHSVDCSSRSLWTMIQFTVDQLLDRVTLADLIGTEQKSQDVLKDLLLQKEQQF